jgi:Family of unknown function (DUF6622)
MIAEILRHTPLWVFGLFALLLALGLQQARARNVGLARLALLPLLMLGLSFNGVASAFGARLLPLACWAAALAAVAAGSLVLPPQPGAAYNPALRRFSVPGSWLPLALMMTIFFTKYAVAVASARAPELARADAFAATASLAYGVFSGLFFARALRILRTARA